MLTLAQSTTRATGCRPAHIARGLNLSLQPTCRQPHLFVGLHAGLPCLEHEQTAEPISDDRLRCARVPNIGPLHAQSSSKLDNMHRKAAPQQGGLAHLTKQTLGGAFRNLGRLLAFSST